MTEDRLWDTRRRTVLQRLGVSVGVAGLAGCFSGEDGDSSPDGGDTPTEGAVGTPSGDGGTPTGGGGETQSPDGGETPTGGGSSGVRTAGPDAGYNWDDVADREETSGFDLPDEAPTAFGYTRVASDNQLTISYGSASGSKTVESGTLYVLLVVDGSAEGVLVWEPPIESGDEILVGPPGSTLEMDVETVSAIVFAWEYQSELYVVDKKDEYL